VAKNAEIYREQLTASTVATALQRMTPTTNQYLHVQQLAVDYSKPTVIVYVALSARSWPAKVRKIVRISLEKMQNLFIYHYLR
jgi:hypothetical protein